VSFTVNRRKIVELLVALVGGISAALGQVFLLFVLFPSFITAYGIWVLVSLLCFNCGMGIILLSYADRFY